VSIVSRPIAEELAKKQREISVAEFFERNKQILGFDSPTRALLTACKEAVDNALDACEEAGVLPDISVEIKAVPGAKDEFILMVEDNGPGIVKRNIPSVFAQLLYGSRFHAVRQSRGQQGIGISAAVLYGQLTTGKHALVTSKIGKGRPAIQMELAIDTKKNQPEIIKESLDSWDKDSGTRVEIPMTGRYTRGKQSPFEYLRATAIVNPHLALTFIEPDGTTTVFERASDALPPAAKEIKPHPLGTEMGTLLKMARGYNGRRLSAFLQNEFSSMGGRTVTEVLKKAGLNASDDPRSLSRDDGAKLLEAFRTVKIMAPPTDCLSPIGEVLTKRGLKKETVDVSPEFIVSASRPASVYSGHPFQVEVGIVYGGSLPKEESVKILRYANRVPLLYQQGACAMTNAIAEIDWRRYGLDQRGGKGIPVGPAIFLVHIAATKVPFTSEAKEAVAEVPEILNEVKLAFRDCARSLARHLAKKTKRAKAREKFVLISKILPMIAEKSAKMIRKPVPDIAKVVCEIMDVVWIEDAVEYEKMKDAAKAASKPAPKGAKTLTDYDDKAAAPAPTSTIKDPYLARSTIQVHNYTKRKRKMELYAVIPKHAVLAESNPPVKTTKEAYLVWDVPALGPAEKHEIKFTLAGVEKGDFDENELFVDGVGDLHVVGADLWRGEEGSLAADETQTPDLPQEADEPAEDLEEEGEEPEEEEES
jgi:DNA topoisomerase VI subunit B